MAGLETKEVTIDGVEYSILTLDALKARPIWVRLFKCLGPGLEAAGKAEGEAAGLALFGKVLEALPESLLNEMSDLYAEHSFVKIGDKAPKVASVFKLHFAGKPMHWFKWLLECSKVNFADFLEALSSLGLAPVAPILSK